MSNTTARTARDAFEAWALQVGYFPSSSTTSGTNAPSAVFEAWQASAAHFAQRESVLVAVVQSVIRDLDGPGETSYETEALARAAIQSATTGRDGNG